MSRVATVDELADLRAAGQWSRLWLAVYKPNVIYTALLNGAPSSNDLVGQVSYDGGSGTLADVKAEMTLWVGSTAGARDLGIARIRKAPISGTFYIGLTSEIAWADNCHLTVVDMAMPWSKPVYINSGSMQVDTDIAYSDQHTNFTPVVRMGPHAVAWLTGATVSIGFSATAFAPGSSISTWSWSAPGASATSGTTGASPTITYNAAGMYRVYCTVTAANGKSFTGVRHVMIFNDANPPKKIELTDDPNASYSEGGWEFGVRMYAGADTDEIVEGALCVLFSEDRIKGEETSIGAVTNRGNIVCVGYLDGESITWDAEASEVEFNVRGLHRWMDMIETNPITLNMAADTPADWDTVTGLTVDRALHHLLVWRSNIAAIADVTLTSDTRYAPVVDSSEGTLWSQLEQMAWDKVFAHGGVDKYGRLFVEIDPQLTPEASRTWATVMTLTEKDWQDRIEAARITNKKTSMVSTSGWITQLGGATSTLYSLAMGHIRARTGKSEIIDKLLASSQSQFNTLAGLYCGFKNIEWNFNFRMPQNNRILDLFPRQFLDVTLAAGDTPRGIGYAGNLIPRSITLRYDADALSFSTDLSCEPETFPTIAMDGDVPATSGVEDWDDSFSPEMSMPDLTTIPEIITMPPTVENQNHPKKVVISTSQGVFYTTGFDETQPVWVAMNNGLDDTDKVEIANLVVTPSGAMYLLTNGDTTDGWTRVYRAAGLGSSWTLVFENTDYGDSSARITGLGVRKDAADSVALLVGVNYVHFGSLDTHRIYIGSGGSFSAGGYVRQKYASRYNAIVFRMGHWFVFGSVPTGIGGTLPDPRVWIYTASGSLVSAANGVDWGGGAGAGAGSTYANGNGELINWGNGVDGYNIIHDALATDMDWITTSIDPINLSMSPDGTKGMAISGVTPYKSTDSGATWSSVGGTVPTSLDVIENCGDGNRWILAGGTAIKLTLDQGATAPINKDGNLTFIAPLVDVQIARYIS